jgi:hypothetical protein
MLGFYYKTLVYVKLTCWNPIQCEHGFNFLMFGVYFKVCLLEFHFSCFETSNIYVCIIFLFSKMMLGVDLIMHNI